MICRNSAVTIRLDNSHHYVFCFITQAEASSDCEFTNFTDTKIRHFERNVSLTS
jgi:hypothetical protein